MNQREHSGKRTREKIDRTKLSKEKKEGLCHFTNGWKKRKVEGVERKSLGAASKEKPRPFGKGTLGGRGEYTNRNDPRPAELFQKTKQKILRGGTSGEKQKKTGVNHGVYNIRKNLYLKNRKMSSRKGAATVPGLEEGRDR